MTLSQLQAFTAQFAFDVGQSRYSALYVNVINEAQVQFALDTRCLFKDQAISVVSGTAVYALPSDFMFEKKVTLSTVNNAVGGIGLKPVSRATLEFYNTAQDWTQINGTPTNYIIDPELARQQIRLYPVPQGADAGTNNLLLTYYPLPATLVNPTDVPLNGNLLLAEHHIGIAAYAAWLLLQAEVATPETIAKLQQLYKLYQDKVTICIDRWGNTSSEGLRFLGGRTWH